MRVLSLVLVASLPALANSTGGITGRSGKTAGVTCSGCHSPQVSMGAAVTVTGPTSVIAGTRASYTVTLTGGPGAWGGTDIACDVGTLANRDGSLRVAGAELTHSDKRMFSGGMVSWQFYWTAPLTAGPAKLWVAAQSVDGSGNTSGDQQSLTQVSITVTPANQAPTVATAAAATPAAVTGTTTSLSVLGADDAGEAALVYTWSLVSGPAAVTFSANASNAAKAATATFTRAGAYVLNARLADAGGLFVNSTVNVTVTQTYTSLRVTPATRTLSLGSQLQLSAAAFDQFGQAMTLPGTVTWAASAGTITTAGLYTTPAAAGGPHTITATCAAKPGTAAITVVLGSPPVVATAAAAAVNSSTELTLTVLGSDDGGEALLRYLWSSTGPAAAAFAANNTNAAKSAVASLTRAGTYVFTVTITDRAGLTVTSTVTATVAAQYSAVQVAPAAVTVKPNETALLAATALDQFNRPMAAPGAVSWVSFGGGTVSGSGEYRAGATLGGPFQVRATLSGKTATSDVTIANGGIPVLLGVPSATPAAIAGRTTRLRVAADDEAGEPDLEYRWEAAGPAPVLFTPNDTNAAKLATATFEQVGTYTLTVTITNAAAKSVAATLDVEVLATADRLVVSPDQVTLRANGVQAFTAEVIDQFGDAMPMSGAPGWATLNAGQIDEGGLLRALGTPGRYTVSATAMGLRGQAQVTVDATPPVVELESPIALALLKGDVTLTAKVSDDDVLAVVRFYSDDVLIGQATAPPWAVTWATTTATDASHELTVSAEDAAGNRATTKSVQVQVWNDPNRPPPGPSIAEGAGCTSAGGTIAPLCLLLALVAVRRSGVSRKVTRGRDTRPLPAPKCLTRRPAAAGTPGATRTT